MRYLRVAIVGGLLAFAIGGCGSGDTRTATTGAEVVSGECPSASASGRTVSQSCVLVLSDGQQFRCPTAFEGQTPIAHELERAKGCVRLASLTLSPAVRSMTTTLDVARGCLTRKGLRVLGGPVLPPNPAGSSAADGELVVVNDHHPAFIAYYTDASRARRLEAAVVQNAHRFGGRVEPRGAETIIWTRAPTGTVRYAVEGCVFR